ncbi:hypothetical protein IJ102_01490 [Candidatus Saccharibacteria bacterium]|nr:hypothetical protein [Candidatus Saccharibacteria bacterium]
MLRKNLEIDIKGETTHLPLKGGSTATNADSAHIQWDDAQCVVLVIAPESGAFQTTKQRKAVKKELKAILAKASRESRPGIGGSLTGKGLPIEDALSGFCIYYPERGFDLTKAKHQKAATKLFGTFDTWLDQNCVVDEAKEKKLELAEYFDDPEVEVTEVAEDRESYIAPTVAPDPAPEPTKADAEPPEGTQAASPDDAGPAGTKRLRPKDTTTQAKKPAPTPMVGPAYKPWWHGLDPADKTAWQAAARQFLDS